MGNRKDYAIVTGASSGIGFEFAKLLAADNINLILTARTKPALDALAEELTAKYGITVYVLQLDLSDINSADEIFKFTSSNNIRIEYLINNAGFGDYTFFPESDLTRTQEMINLNISTLTRLCRLYLPEMIRSKTGRILNVASVAAFQPGPLMSVYYASKSYVLSFSLALRRELKGTGVSMTCLCPGPTKSLFWERARSNTSRLTEIFKMPDSGQVARYGWISLLKNKSIAIYGFENKLMIFFERFIPRNILTGMAYILNKSKNS